LDQIFEELVDKRKTKTCRGGKRGQYVTTNIHSSKITHHPKIISNIFIIFCMSKQLFVHVVLKVHVSIPY
jgi:hypothetical protein